MRTYTKGPGKPCKQSASFFNIKVAFGLFPQTLLKYSYLQLSSKLPFNNLSLFAVLNFACFFTSCWHKNHRFYFKGNRDSLFWSHLRTWPGNTDLDDLNSMIQCRCSFRKLYRFTEQRKSYIKASLKYIGDYIREADTARWEKSFYMPMMLSDVSLRFWVSESWWSPKLIGYKGFS